MSTGEVPREDTKLYVFRQSLSKEQKSLIDVWALSKPDMKVNELISQLKIQYHIDRQEASQDEPVALYGEAKKEKMKPQTSKKENVKSKDGAPLCNHCREPGHGWRNCSKYKEELNRKKKFAKKKESPSGSAYMAHEGSEMNIDDNDSDNSSYCEIVGEVRPHIATSEDSDMDCNDVMDPSYDPEISCDSSSKSIKKPPIMIDPKKSVKPNNVYQLDAKQCKNMTHVTGTIWCLDGCLSKWHTSSEILWLKDFQKFDEPGVQINCGGNQVLAKGIGNVWLDFKGLRFVLKVWYTPSRSGNYISLVNLIEQGGHLSRQGDSIKIEKENSPTLFANYMHEHCKWAVMLTAELEVCSLDKVMVNTNFQNFHKHFGSMSLTDIARAARIRLNNKLNLEFRPLEMQCITCDLARDKHISKCTLWHPKNGQATEETTRQETALMSVSTLREIKGVTEWVVDSGASSHMTPTKNLLKKYTD